MWTFFNAPAPGSPYGERRGWGFENRTIQPRPTIMPVRTTTKGLRAVYVNTKCTTPHTLHPSMIGALEELERIRLSVQARPFDPATLVQPARAQWSELPHLVAAFARCTQEWPESDLYTHFISPADMQARWKFAATLPLAHPHWGTLMVDVIHDASVPGGHAIGGIEYLDRVMGRPIAVAELVAMLHGARTAREARRDRA